MRPKRVLEAVLSGRSDANIRFESLCKLLIWLEFAQHGSGSHHMFSRPGVVELVNLQADGEKAKRYQVRQVREVILRYGLHREGK
jgi:hypothetical protein